MNFVETLVDFQENWKEPPCQILQRVKFVSLHWPKLVSSTVTVSLMFIHCIHGFMVKSVDGILVDKRVHPDRQIKARR